ncbi:TOMM precursor leader peptide-binding protein [Streptomyces sp. ASQP_92]|uniref:TOMM precursor leader peptide-binding protein n=1 Tax=Streptomyces sp. ASQP_92 TaxID=2979116 RepID=UPI0021C1ACA3|nr:TOMM precursor leader peptide-binding protein [Streptomyces sp. ASQP_92]MCT9089603.1 TOMM precursor leader peptide-binding protein [Streptomyces sp. ASQP_92]
MSPEEPADCLYLVRDAFGEQYAEAYAISPVVRVTGEELPDDTRLARAGTIVVVHSGRLEELRDAVDRFGFERGVPTVGLELLPTRIVCGPAVIPGATACYACYLRRIEQHRDPAQPYDVGPATRGLPEGFGRPHLAIAHGLLTLALAELRTGPTGLGGTVRTFDLVTGTLSSAPTVAVDRCARCGERLRAAAPDAVASLAGLP